MWGLCRVSPKQGYLAPDCAEEVFIAEVEVLRSQLYESDVVIEGEFLSDAQMEAEGVSEPLV